MSEDRGQGILLVFGQEKGTCAWATCRDQADVLGQENAPVFADELNAVVDEDQGDFAELCLLFRVQERVVQRVAQLLQDWQENSELLRRE